MTGQYQPGQGFTATSPRQAMAQALLQQGASRAPVSSPLEGIARMLQAGIGGWLGGQVRQDQKDALADALKALEDPSVPEAGRAKAAYAAYNAKNPDGPNPFEATMMAQAVPKERFVEVKNDKGQVIGQRSTLSGKLEPFKLDSVSGGQTLVNAFGEPVAGGGPKLGEGQLFDPKTNTVSTVPNFTESMRAIKQAEAGGSAQGKADVDLVMNPRIIAGETPAKARQAGAITNANEAAAMPYVAPKAAATASGNIQGQLAPVQTAEGPRPGVQVLQERTQVGQRQGQNAVPVAPPGFAVQEEGMAPIPGGPADPEYIKGVKGAEAEAGLPGKQFERENSLRDEFKDLTKDFRTVQDAYTKMQGAAKDPTGAGDMSLLYSYVKLLDPGSVVRESEFATAAASGSLGERVQGLFNRVASGERLPDTLRNEFVNQGAKIYEAQKRGYENLGAQYTELAKRYGVKPENVVTRYDIASDAKTAEAPPTLTRITNDAAGRMAFDKLAPGAPYTGPDGKNYLKPLGAPK